MSNANVVQKPSPRIEQEREQRRRRVDMGDGRLRNLAVTGHQDPNYAYRWVNDDPGRLHSLTVMDDWDRVTEDMLGVRHEKDKGVGSGVERVVDKVTGKRAVLLRKPKDYYAEDRAKAQARIDEIESIIKSGGSVSPQGLQATDRQAAYVPSGGIVMDDGRRN